VADVVVEESGIHTPDYRPRLSRLGSATPGDFAACRAALAAKPDRSVGQIDVSNLEAGDQLCVGTDLGNIALIRISGITKDSLGQLVTLTVAFVVWPL
jgi:hypothetical protein